jgi:hypothetical protein
MSECPHGAGPACLICASRARVLSRGRQRAGGVPAPAAPPPDLSCPSRGGPLALVPCSCAGGDPAARVQAYLCDVHGKCTTDPRKAARDGTRRCQTCPDLPARQAAAPAAPAWAAGLTAVARRRETTLRRTLAGLEAAGFPEPHLYVDGPHDAAWDALPHAKTFRPNVRTFGNWVLAAWDLILRHPGAARYLIVQDDVLFARNVRGYLDVSAWPAAGYLNLYAHPAQTSVPPAPGFAPAAQPGLGALALAFTRDALEKILTSRGMADRSRRPQTPHFRPWKSVDGAVSEAARASGLREYVHRPSLADHAGTRSTRGNGWKGERRGRDFPGEGFDALSLLAARPSPAAEMPAHQRRRVLAEIAKRSPCRVLVFGAGSDTAGIVRANRGGRTVVLEDQPEWLAAAREAGAETHAVAYATRAGELLEPCPPLAVPASVECERFDVILIDGPKGGTPDAPGRQQAAFLASRLIAPGGVILAHDAARPADAACYARHLGVPVETVTGPPDLAVFRGPS